MEHLPRQIDQPGRPKVHFYVEVRGYTPEEFFKIPTDYGCKEYEDLLEKGLPKDMDVKKANTFLQSWLYFALLAQVLGTSIHSGDFMDDERHSLHTEKLNYHLRAWNEREQVEANKGVTAEQTNRYLRGSMALEHARRFVSKHLSHKAMDRASTAEPGDEGLISKIHGNIDQKLTLSLAILGETLQQARPAMPNNLQDRFQFGKHPSTMERSWGYSAYNRAVMRQGKWCPLEIHRIESTMPTVSEVYYASTVQQSGRNEVDHDKAGCTAGGCEAERSTRPPLHYCHAGPCGTAGLEEQQIVDIIRSGKTPMVTWCRRRNPKLRVVAYDLNKDKVRFGALSHSWEEEIVASGLDERPGNNRLMHVCQIQELQKSFNELVKANGNASEIDDVPFWIDVLCFPRSSDIQADAMNQLKTVYSNAEAVIVWDRNLMRREKLTHEDTIEMNVRIRTGDWSQRLWTLQEAVLARKLYVEFSGPKFLSLEEIEFARDRAKADLADKYHHIWMAGDPFSAAVDGLRAGQDSRVQNAWEAVQFRQSRHPEEETLVLANVLRLNAAAIASICGHHLSSDVVAAKRMEKFLDLLEQTPGLGIPPGLIFLPKRSPKGSALDVTTGFGWAPRTWMGRQSHTYPLTRPVCQTALLMKHGLLVRLPGMILHCPNERYTSSTFHVPIAEPLHKWWKVKIDIDEDCAAAFWREEICPSQEPSIILSVENPGLRWEIGVLVRRIGTRGGDVRWVKVLCRAWVRLETYSSTLYENINKFRYNKDWMGFGERLPTSQMWCVDGGTSGGA